MYISSLFDPLGFAYPTITYAKMKLQTVWRLQLDWDSQVSDGFARYSLKQLGYGEHACVFVRFRISINIMHLLVAKPNVLNMVHVKNGQCLVKKIRRLLEISFADFGTTLEGKFMDEQVVEFIEKSLGDYLDNFLKKFLQNFYLKKNPEKLPHKII